MQIKISKTLEAIIARAAFNTTKAGLDHSLKDFLTLELLREEGSLAYQLLSSRLKDWELYQIRLRIEREVISAKQQETRSPEEYYRDFTEELLVMPGVARSVSTAHALLAIISDRSTATARVLEMYGVTADSVSGDLQKFAVGDDFRTEVQVHMLDFGEENRNEEKGPAHLLDKFGVNLTRLAREGKIDPVIGREQEIERVVQILSRRKKNNPILIGEAGVGKSAIVEGLALRIARGEVPYTIADKTLFSLDVSSLVAGTKFRGEFEERMQQLLDELRKAKDTIIFIDEIHTIVGAGSTQGSLDTANILKPALARGELQTIGATTLDEYRENIESDSALERRFQKVVVEPTTPDQTLQILRNIAPHYERHHKVRYTEEALQACVTLTGRYITDRFFPDKAIDVMDEAGSRIHLQSAREPAELREMETALTDAQRERREAVEALLAKLGVTLSVIPGEREAALSFAGASCDFPGERLLVVDIGGGSTEVIAGRAGGVPDRVHSFNIGCRRVTEKFFAADPPSAVELERARAWVGEGMRPYFDELRGAGFAPQRLVAVAGTATTVVSIHERMEVYDTSRVHKAVITRPVLDGVAARLEGVPLVQRERIVGLDPGRAPVIVAGMVILQTVLDLAGVDSFTVSESDILHGIILDEAAR